jgi:methylated-DNA-[protein]-cysteine S-methyltransferase
MRTEVILAKPLGCCLKIKGGEKIVSIEFVPLKHKLGKIDLPISRDMIRYFEGEIIDFSSYEVDLGSLTSFEKKVLEKTREIRYGQRLTYSELAGLIGTSGIRAVGNALAKNPIPIVIPCHRVVTKKGLGGYSGGIELKKKLLSFEIANVQQLKG